MQINPGITRVQVRHPQLANLSDIDEGKGNVIAFLEEMAMVKSTAVEQPASGLRRLCGSQTVPCDFLFCPIESNIFVTCRSHEFL